MGSLNLVQVLVMEQERIQKRGRKIEQTTVNLIEQ